VHQQHDDRALRRLTNDVGVDPTTQDVVYVSGVEMYKCVRNATTGAWSVSNIGSDIHPDSHTLGFHRR